MQMSQFLCEVWGQLRYAPGERPWQITTGLSNLQTLFTWSRTSSFPSSGDDGFSLRQNINVYKTMSFAVLLFFQCDVKWCSLGYRVFYDFSEIDRCKGGNSWSVISNSVNLFKSQAFNCALFGSQSAPRPDVLSKECCHETPYLCW